MNTKTVPSVDLGSSEGLGPTLELLNRVLPCNPPWGPGQYVNVERVGLLLDEERKKRQKLEAALWRLLDGSQHCGEMQWCGMDDESPWEAARAALRA